MSKNDKHVDRSTGEILDSINAGRALMAAASEMPFLRSSYSNHAAYSDSFGLRCEDPSLARQEFRDECDINTIVKRFGLTGLVPQNVRAPVSGDFTGISNFQDAMSAILQARDSFAQMPAYIRAEFGNDPARFVDFCSDPANEGKLAEFGLLKPEAFEAYQERRQKEAAKELEAKALAAGFVRPDPSKGS